MDPTWVVLREQFALLVTAVQVDEDSGQLVRGARYSGKNRILRWLALGVVKSLEVVGRLTDECRAADSAALGGAHSRGRSCTDHGQV